jgi:hypothetical protein
MVMGGMSVLTIIFQRAAFFCSIKRKEQHSAAFTSKPPQQSSHFDVMQQNERAPAAGADAAAVDAGRSHLGHRQNLAQSDTFQAVSRIAQQQQQQQQQQHSVAHLQAYATFNQRDHVVDSSAVSFRRFSHDEAAAANLDIGPVANERSSSSSSAGAGGADEGQFISSLMGAQQAQMRVYV